ncbi:hypothetical protein MKEN_01479000 [Mycena kentingensis (nom. inval.)]|nr:hypothetical protein MKEN_01479000 [Mycena kentingensis (nom. inval.)]
MAGFATVVAEDVCLTQRRRTERMERAAEYEEELDIVLWVGATAVCVESRLFSKDKVPAESLVEKLNVQDSRKRYLNLGQRGLPRSEDACPSERDAAPGLVRKETRSGRRKGAIAAAASYVPFSSSVTLGRQPTPIPVERHYLRRVAVENRACFGIGLAGFGWTSFYDFGGSRFGESRGDGQLQAAELDATHDAHLHVPPRRPILRPRDPMSMDDLRRSADRSALIVLTRLCAAFVAIYYAALVVKPSPYRCLFFLPLLGIAIHALSVTSRVPLVDYYIGALLWISLVAASDHILLTDVQRELYVLGEKPIVRAGLQERMFWAARLLGDRRALGWVHEERQATPPRPKMPRPRFVASRLLRGTVALVFAETVNAYNELYTPALYPDGPSLAPTKILLFAIPYASYMVALDALNDAFAVATRRARPIDCPSGTGPLAQLYSLRNFWGRVWHQQNRRLLTAHGKFLAHKLLRLRRGSVASAYTQLYAAFLLSGLMHYLPEYMALRHWGGGGMRFFVLQAVGITLEDMLGRCFGVKGARGWRLLGYGWVWAWFALTAPPWLDPLLRAGVFEPFLRSYVFLLWLRTR